MLDLRFVLEATGGRLAGSAGAERFGGVSTDSRRIRRGELFFALVGERHDGHDFIAEALARGAAGAVVERPPAGVPEGATLVVVPSTLRALGDLARAWRRSFPALKVGAITGSNGKTTTKEMAASIVSLRYDTLKTAGNYNNEIGLPLTLLNLTPAHERAVVELGMNARGEIRRLARMARPDVGAVTNVGLAHVGMLGGGIEAVAEAKGELVEELGPDGVFVANLDDPWVRRLATRAACRTITTSLERNDADVTATDIVPDGARAVRFTLHIEGQALPLRLRGIGVHNVRNALTAAAVAVGLGCGADHVQAGLERFRPEQMRLEVMETPGGLTIINDAYNANPDSVRSAIEELARLRDRGRAVAVLGDMLELGDGAAEEHAAVGRFAAEKGIDLVVGVGELAAHAAEAAHECGAVGVVAADHAEAAAIVEAEAAAGDVVLVKGSRGMRMEKVVEILFERTEE